MAHLIDTSLLIRQADTRSSDRPLALQAIRTLFYQEQALNVFPQNMIEFWAVATRPPEANGLGLTIADAEEERVRLETLFTLLPEPANLYARWVGLVNDFGVSGKPTHDARIVAAMLESGLTHILTFNARDFRRYASLGLIVIEPGDI